MTKKKTEEEKVKSKPIGRPPIEITPAMIKKAKGYAAKGLAKKYIAINLGLSYETFNERTKDIPEFLEAIEQGYAESIKEVSSAVYESAIGGDVQAQKYFLNNRDNDNWKDRRDVKVETLMTYEDMSDEELEAELKIREEEHG